MRVEHFSLVAMAANAARVVRVTRPTHPYLLDELASAVEEDLMGEGRVTDAPGARRIVWLASYPKSGNTWMRAFLSNYLADGDKPVDINSLDTGGPIASARTIFDEAVGVEASDLTQDEIERYRPRVYRAGRC